MHVLVNLLLFFVILEWTFTESLTFTPNQPTREVEKRLKDYLDGKKHKFSFKRLWRKIHRFKACKTSFKQKLHLCAAVLGGEPYNVDFLEEAETQPCETRRVSMGNNYDYYLNMFTCRSKDSAQPYYFISNAFENEPSPSLYLLKFVKTLRRIQVEALVTLSKIDKETLTMVGQFEREKKFHQGAHDVAVAAAMYLR